MNNILCELLGIKYPIIQAGMVWVSGAKLAAAASSAGCLGVIGAGSMNLELLESQILKAQKLSSHPQNIAVNLPLLYDKIEQQIEVCLKSGITKFITSAGSPKKFTKYLKDRGCVVIHVVSSPELALKCEQAGVDAVVAEGFEAGGHNGRDEITTMCLIPQVVDQLTIPVIAAGGIGDGRTMAAAFCLGAHGVQMGTRFLMTKESSAHENFKTLILNSGAGDTKLMMKSYVPVRLLKNKFFEEVLKLEQNCATSEELVELLGKGRARDGMLHGDLERGELEIGQISALMDKVMSCEDLVNELVRDCSRIRKCF